MQRKANKEEVRAKKHLGQHFLTDENIARKIVDALVTPCTTASVLEIGPGMGVLTKYLLSEKGFQLYAIDIDKESIAYLHTHFPALGDKLIDGDFLRLDLASVIEGPFSLIGNFPYNISSQIIFKVLENRNQVPLVVGMFQKEVAERFCGAPRSKEYGILSVLTQTYYETSYLFTVDENVFSPPPRVKSAVIRLQRRAQDYEVDEQLLFRVVKAAFNQRRKKLRNAISQFGIADEVLQAAGYIDRRAEELSVSDFISLTHLVAQHGKA